MKVVYTDRAWKDLELAFDWYEEQNPGLGLEFLD
jgi:plasmid stabilization system protein ParE